MVEDEETHNKEEMEANVEKKRSDGLVLKELPEHLKCLFGKGEIITCDHSC